MTFEKRKPKHDYRAFLTSEEIRDLDKIDVEAVHIDARRRKLSRERALIVTRAIQRSRREGGAV
ncbi:conserved protein of unknown function [Hyphomicrobium sp. 1Nfss2.1]|uniref:hypothetical protein n=1 Tax=Hyphomicrobium sp. 1Nfss2.1 TaxID=3413936 RepID=UPI003C7E0B93